MKSEITDAAAIIAGAISDLATAVFFGLIIGGCFAHG